MFYGWDPDKHFFVPDEVLASFRQAVPEGRKLVADWDAKFARYAAEYPKEAAEMTRRFSQELPAGWDSALKSYAVGDAVATRIASQQAINSLAPVLPELFGGAADLSESNMTDIKDGGMFSADSPLSRNIRFGVREHAMGAIATGIALYGAYVPYCATFMVFSDYMRGAVRLAALSCQRVVYVWTHDSVAVGEDGPTHEPIEHVAGLRTVPGLDVIRPGDANETAAAWAAAVGKKDGPTALALTRQKLPTLPGTAELAREGVARGGYVLRRESGSDGASAGKPDLVIVATGSELSLAVAAADNLEKDGIRTRVVSLPCWERFERQDAAYRESVLPKAARKRLTVEVLSPFGWERYAGDEGAIMGVDHFGASAPGELIMEKFGFTPERVTEIGRKVVREGLSGFVGTAEPAPHQC